MMEKLQGFVQENKFRPGASGTEIETDYHNDLTEARQQVEGLQITKRVASTGICACYLGVESLLTRLQDRSYRPDDKRQAFHQEMVSHDQERRHLQLLALRKLLRPRLQGVPRVQQSRKNLLLLRMVLYRRKHPRHHHRAQQQRLRHPTLQAMVQLLRSQPRPSARLHRLQRLNQNQNQNHSQCM